MRFFLFAISLSWALITSTALAHGELHERLDEVNRGIELNPENPMLYLGRGELFREHGDLAEAVADFERAMVLGNDLPLAYFHIGRLMLYSGDLAKAEEFLKDYLNRIDDKDRDSRTRRSAFVNLAITYQQQGRHLDEAEQYKMAILSAEWPAAGDYVSRAKAYVAAGDSYLKQARTGLNEGIDKLGPQAELLDYAIEVDLLTGDVNTALSRLDSMIATANRKERLQFRRGQILDHADRQIEAVDAYQQALKSIEALPAGRRDTPSITRLRTSIEIALAQQNALDVDH